MAESDTKGKRSIVLLSSSSEDDSDSGTSEDEESEEEDEFDDEDDCDDEDSDEHEDEDGEVKDDNESLCNEVILHLQGRNDLEPLRLKECKAYLRVHGLRLSGTKAVCVQRIKDHWRLKDGNGKILYPRSSFSINCTGDVCKGDVVLFTQKVYAKFNKMNQSGKVIGKRTVAGRVVKESYGSAKQQHTFTVEVIWSTGIKQLPPLFPLLVKGRNLYRLKTFRQKWKNEAERVEVLDEKHRRGAAARLARAMKRKEFTADRGTRCKDRKHSRPSKKRKHGKLKKFSSDGQLEVTSQSKIYQPQQGSPSKQAKFKHKAIL